MERHICLNGTEDAFILNGGFSCGDVGDKSLGFSEDRGPAPAWALAGGHTLITCSGTTKQDKTLKS